MEFVFGDDRLPQRLLLSGAEHRGGQGELLRHDRGTPGIALGIPMDAVVGEPALSGWHTVKKGNNWHRKFRGDALQFGRGGSRCGCARRHVGPGGTEHLWPDR